MHGQDAASTLLSIRDAALATGLTPKALRRRIERGTLSSVLIGGRRRIPTEDLIRHGLMSGRARWAAVDASEPATEALTALAHRLDQLEGRVESLERGSPAPARVGAEGADAGPGRDSAVRPANGDSPPDRRRGDRGRVPAEPAPATFAT